MKGTEGGEEGARGRDERKGWREREGREKQEEIGGGRECSGSPNSLH